MAPVKILATLTLVVAASASPTSNRLGFDAKGLTGCIGDLFTGFKNHPWIESNVIDDLCNLSPPSCFDDVINLGTKASTGIRGIINGWIPGLGDIYERCVGCIVKGSLCYSGKPGSKIVCSPSFDKKYGISSTSTEMLISDWRLSSCEEEVVTLVNEHAGGVGKLSGSYKVVVEACIAITKLISKKIIITKGVLSSLYIQMTIILGAIGNSCTSGLGDEITTSLIPPCNKYLITWGCPDISDHQKEIRGSIKQCNADKKPWTKPVLPGKPSNPGGTGNPGNPGQPDSPANLDDLDKRHGPLKPSSPGQARSTDDLDKRHGPLKPSSPGQERSTDDLDKRHGPLKPSSPDQARSTDDLDKRHGPLKPSSPGQERSTDDLDKRHGPLKPGQPGTPGNSGNPDKLDGPFKPGSPGSSCQARIPVKPGQCRPTDPCPPPMPTAEPEPGQPGTPEDSGNPDKSDGPLKPGSPDSSGQARIPVKPGQCRPTDPCPPPVPTMEPEACTPGETGKLGEQGNPGEPGEPRKPGQTEPCGKSSSGQPGNPGKTGQPGVPEIPGGSVKPGQTCGCGKPQPGVPVKLVKPEVVEQIQGAQGSSLK